MRVIFNVDAITAPLTGIGRYALELARGLAQHDEIEQLRLYSAYRWVDDPAQALAANRTIAAIRRSVPFKTQALELYQSMRGALFRLHTRRMKGFLLHTPNYVLMPFDGPALTTVHDLSWLSFPDAHPVERVRFLEKHLPESLARADLVLTDSDFIAAEIAARFSLPRTKIRAIPLGVDAAFRPRTAEEMLATLARHGLEHSAYLLVVATLEPRKNLARLVRAYAALPAMTKARHPLVIVGARGWLNEAFEREIAPLEAGGIVRRLGYVGEDELPQIYAGAHAFAFPSLYEGFGLPVLEAMASGVPVLTSNVSSMPEIAGDVALLVDPNDEQSLRDGLARLLDDSTWRTHASARGIARSRDYRWSRCVDATIDAYRAVNVA
ncbi:MAG TPA: glycosyltransferase family 1 protein [Rhodanobacteraceae bacterium]|nr:glycosyltransferase family 1 protein [Rhodanobacteraceae bacterium]